ncbi:hemerythrin domain-containing protein [Pseudarthrobacter sp. CCNWLW207]|uniref:hemerythrin domain-containing protein n=1 Tax=Pseudarthrobacter sp. CCNWLW207 TaxID=3127468 RepID=UPI003076C721
MEITKMTDFFTMHPGETAVPVPPGPVLSSGSTGIRRVHRFLLWAYGEAPNLVRSTAPGDTSRAAYVGEVLGNFDKVLLIHQEGQDLLMYPQLAERAPASTPHVEQMLDHHGRIRERVQSIEPVRRRWMQTADAEDREALAKGYEDVQSVLKEHLRREVTEVMPAVDRVMTEEELKAMIQHGVKQHDKKFLVTYLGMILATNPPEDRREIFFAEIPAPARLGYRLIGRRMYRKQYATLFPGRPIPETL